jgi:hypothetical protein
MTPAARPLHILLWHLHGSWTDALVRGGHHYLLPTTREGGPWGLGKAGRNWPAACEVPVESLAEADVDVVVLQREDDIPLVRRWLSRTPGADLPAVFVEHNTPRGDVPSKRHPLADSSDIPLVHVTHFNGRMWDSGRAPAVVIEHGIPDPGARYTGELPRAAVVINEPVRRWRYTGTDLLPSLARGAALDVFGMGLDGLADATGLEQPQLRTVGDLAAEKLHGEMARRRFYLHPFRWTSLGLALIEAMQLGMPAVGLAATEAVEAVGPDAGVLSADPETLVDAMRELVADPERARYMGACAREAALRRYGLDRFLADWDRLFAEVTR